METAGGNREGGVNRANRSNIGYREIEPVGEIDQSAKVEKWGHIEMGEYMEYREIDITEKIEKSRKSRKSRK